MPLEILSAILIKNLFNFQRIVPLLSEWERRTIKGLKKGYWEGRKDEPMALFGSGGFLEISIREGNAQKVLKVKKGDRFKIKFSCRLQIANCICVAASSGLTNLKSL